MKIKVRKFFRTLKIGKGLKLFVIGILAFGIVGGAFLSFRKAEPTNGNVKENKKVAVLTFDDGPSKSTEKILDILDEHDIKACFFVIGAGKEKGQEIIKEIHSRGHLVCPHSFSHKYEEIYSSSEAYMKDFEEICDYIEEATGELPKIFRFPGGSKNSLGVKNGVMNEIKKKTKEKGFSYLDWNVVSGDDTPTVYPPERLLENIKKDLKKAKSPAVILFHDTYHNKTTPEATELCIKHLEELGYTFKRADEIDLEVKFK